MGRKLDRAPGPAHRALELFRVVGDGGAGAAQRERRPDQGGVAGRAHDVLGFLDRLRVARAGQGQADALDGLLEQLAVLGLADGRDLGADELDAEALQRAVVVQRHRQVEGRLAAQRGQQRVGPLALDDLGHELRRQRLHVRPAGHLGVGHDGGRVRVHQHDLEPFLAQRPAALRARVVELAGLPDDDGP